MAIYHYVADSPTGDRVRGKLEAVDEAAAIRELSSRGLTVVSLSTGPAAAGKPLSDEQLTTLGHAVETAAANRLPLEVTLAALAEDADDRRLADVARRLAAQLQRGASMDEAVSSLGRQVPAEVRGLFRVAADCGDLAGTFERFARQRMASQKTRRRIRAAVYYPALMLAILVPVALFLSLFVIPMFGELYDEFDLSLPAATLLLLNTAKQMPLLVGGLLLVVLGGPAFLRAVGGRSVVDGVRIAVPALGRLWMWSGQREFAATLASFLDLRLPLGDAVAHTGDVLSDRNLAEACTRLNQRLQSGQPLSASMGQSIHFDRSLVALAAWGETHGMLPQALHIATEVFDDRIEQRASLIRRVLPPVMLVVVGAGLLFVVGGLMVPLVQLIENL